MAHFAKLDENNVVIDINVVDNHLLLDDNNVEQESLGLEFLIQWSGGYTNWKQTSYNRNFRKNYAVIGGTYDPTKDIFIPPKPFSSWHFNNETDSWDPPFDPPNDGNEYVWNEASLSWILVSFLGE